jgi:hypothetical protein
MGVATMEDLQGTLEVIVFPRLYEQTLTIWAEGAILLVAGRVDHKGEETVLLADTVWAWEGATTLGPDAFARAVARDDRGRRNGNGNGYTRRPVAYQGRDDAAPVAVAAQPALVAVGPGTADLAAAPVVRTVPRVSPLRGVLLEGYLDVVISRPDQRPAPVAGAQREDPFADDEPAMPEEVARVSAALAESATQPLSATPGQSLHVRFGDADQDQLLSAFSTLRQVIHEHPGETPVVLHIPAGSGRSQRMELRLGVAYDGGLVAALERRLGAGLLDLTLHD